LGRSSSRARQRPFFLPPSSSPLSEASLQLLWFILTNLLAGWLAAQLVRGIGFGMLGNTVIGMIGGVIGNAFFHSLNFYAGGGWLGSFIVATAGAVVLLFLVGLIKKA
jgi:uncharacterized membrane protein YeaQ/YmgE (transglycosylase-associated protein family)